MPTVEERVTILETTVTEMLDQILARARTSEVASLEAARDTIKTAQEDTNSALSDRLSKLERSLAALQLGQARVLRRDDNSELPEDIDFASGKGPVIEDDEGNSWKIVVSTEGDLSTEEV